MPVNASIEKLPDDGGVYDEWDDSPQNLAREERHFRELREREKPIDPIELARTPWAQHAGGLAEWTMRHLVNRTDVYGAYLPIAKREGRDISYTAPAVKWRGYRFLTAEIIEEHFAGADVGDIIGLHTTGPDNTCLWAAWDIDHHDDDPIRPIQR